MFRYMSIAGLIIMIVMTGSVIMSTLPVTGEIELITSIAGKLILLPVGMFLFFFPKNIIIASVMFLGTLIIILSLGGSLI